MYSRKNRKRIKRFPLAGLRREQNIINDAGAIIVGEPSYTAIIFEYCTVQPISGYSKTLLDEGIREKVSYTIYTSTKPHYAKEKTDQIEDLISFDDYLLSVHDVNTWQNDLIPHYDNTCVKNDEYTFVSDLVLPDDLLYDLPTGYDQDVWKQMWLNSRRYVELVNSLYRVINFDLTSGDVQDWWNMWK